METIDSTVSIWIFMLLFGALSSSELMIESSELPEHHYQIPRPSLLLYVLHPSISWWLLLREFHELSLFSYVIRSTAGPPFFSHLLVLEMHHFQCPYPHHLRFLKVQSASQNKITSEELRIVA